MFPGHLYTSESKRTFHTYPTEVSAYIFPYIIRMQK